MHSFLDFANPQVHTLLWVQVVGMPIAFLVRAVVLAVRAFREPASKQKHIIRAVSNVLFAVSCWTFGWSHVLAVACFASGIGLSIRAFVIARAQAIRTAPVFASPAKTPSATRSNRSMRQARMRRTPN